VEGLSASLLGWGSTRRLSNVLLKVDVPVASQASCRANEPRAVNQNYINFDNIVCTGGTAGKDSCNGDIGGPAVVTYSGQHYIVGVLVKGTELPAHSGACGVEGRYGVYTAVSKYTDFISTTISGGTYVCQACVTGGVRTSCATAPSPVIPIVPTTTPIAPTPTTTPTLSPIPPALPTPTPAPALPVTTSSDVTFDGLSATDWVGERTVYETGYAIGLGIYDEVANTYLEGCSVQSTIASRRALSVVFSATYPASISTSVQSLVQTLTASTFALSISKANAALGTSVTVPSISQMTTTSSTSNGSDSGLSTGVIIGIAVGGAVVLVGVGIVLYCFCCQHHRKETLHNIELSSSGAGGAVILQDDIPDMPPPSYFQSAARNPSPRNVV